MEDPSKRGSLWKGGLIVKYGDQILNRVDWGTDSSPYFLSRRWKDISALDVPDGNNWLDVFLVRPVDQQRPSL